MPKTPNKTQRQHKKIVIKGYAHGGTVKMGIQPTNQTTMKARGSGAATRGTNFKG